jgi:hypothetical protein
MDDMDEDPYAGVRCLGDKEETQSRRKPEEPTHIQGTGTGYHYHIISIPRNLKLYFSDSGITRQHIQTLRSLAKPTVPSPSPDPHRMVAFHVHGSAALRLPPSSLA